jgi:hypothetical protein
MASSRFRRPRAKGAADFGSVDRAIRRAQRRPRRVICKGLLQLARYRVNLLFREYCRKHRESGVIKLSARECHRPILANARIFRKRFRASSAVESPESPAPDIPSPGGTVGRCLIFSRD